MCPQFFQMAISLWQTCKWFGFGGLIFRDFSYLLGSLWTLRKSIFFGFTQYFGWFRRCRHNRPPKLHPQARSPKLLGLKNRCLHPSNKRRKYIFNNDPSLIYIPDKINTFNLNLKVQNILKVYTDSAFLKLMILGEHGIFSLIWQSFISVMISIS